jgi:hypothetical protein
MTAPAPRTVRILVGASSFADARTALQLAGQLARDSGGFLGGILVEEEAVLSVCRMPRQRIVSVTGAFRAVPTLQELRTLIEADAKAFEALLADVAQSVPGGWSFERELGDLVASMSQAAQSWDVLIFGQQLSHRVHGKVVVLKNADATSAGVPRIADTLAGVLNTELAVIEIGGGGQEPQPAQSSPAATLNTALAQIARINCQAIVTDLSVDQLQNGDGLRRLLMAAQCPVIVLGGTKPQQAN